MMSCSVWTDEKTGEGPLGRPCPLLFPLELTLLPQFLLSNFTIRLSLVDWSHLFSIFLAFAASTHRSVVFLMYVYHDTWTYLRDGASYLIDLIPPIKSLFKIH